MRISGGWGVIVAGAVMALGFRGMAAELPETSLQGQPVAMPEGGAGIGFDDLTFAVQSRRVLVPGGRTGKLFLVDPISRGIAAIPGFSADPSYRGGHGEGTTSADEGGGFLFATDRNAKKVVVIDPSAKEIVASAELGAGPDYIRFVRLTNEVWVTEPRAQRIEVFALSASSAPGLTRAAVIAVPGGPESLVVDEARGRAYTHLWTGTSVAIDLKSRAIAAQWPNGCKGSRGIALDGKRGFLLVGCDEGKAVVLDAAHGGKILSTLESGAGVDVIAYNPALGHLYLPGADSASMAILKLSAGGKLSLLGTVKTAKEAHCVTADDQGGVWVCDPDGGRLLFFKDGFAGAK